MSSYDPARHPPLRCARCGKSPTALGYGFLAEDGESADEYCWTQEGTLDHVSGAFLCDRCYIAWGMPAAASPGRRWTATPAHVAGMRLLFPDPPADRKD